MNKVANDLFQHNEQFKKQISRLANSQYQRRAKAYNAVSIFDVEDLEQEIWCEIFECDCADADIMYDCAEQCAEKVANRGRRKMGKEHFEEIPVSQLGKDERHYVENLFYSTAGGEEE